MKKLYAALALTAAAALALTGCTQADTASYNLSQDADSFKLERRITFINGITDKYLLVVEGRCSINADGEDGQLEVTCKTSETGFKKHYLGLSDNVTYVAEQLDSADVSAYHYKLIFKPETIVPDVETQTSR